MESTARNYFEKFTGLDAAEVLQGLPCTTPATFEDQWLEFKGGTPGETLEKHWSRAIGGFANAEGGVLVWGLDARRDRETGVDAVHKLSLVPDVDKLTSKLHDLSKFVTDPPLSGIKIQPVPINNSKEGCVVCYIPEGKNKPYRSEKDGKKFLMRIGGHFQEPPVSIIRQLFYPKYQPQLDINCRYSKAPLLMCDEIDVVNRDLLPIYFCLELSIKNIGCRTIEAICIGVKTKLGVLNKIGPEKGKDGWLIIRQRNTVEKVSDFLHPDLVGVETLAISDSEDGIDETELNITVYAKDCSPFKAKFLLNRSEKPIRCEDESE